MEVIPIMTRPIPFDPGAVLIYTDDAARFPRTRTLLAFIDADQVSRSLPGDHPAYPAACRTVDAAFYAALDMGVIP